MNNQRVYIRYVAAIASSLFLMTMFQNCGQSGSIALNQQAASSALADLPPTTNTTNYKDYSKVVSVSQASSKVDVLVVIDNSGSMSYEQKNMASRFNTFLSKLQGLDWQVGITTTDCDPDTASTAYRKDGRLLPFNGLNTYLIKSTDDFSMAQSAFSSTVQRPANEGSGLEQGVKATYRALERSLDPTGPNVGLIRDGAALSVILVSDSDETVTSNSKTGDESTFGFKNFAQNLYDYVQNTYPGKSFKFSSIIVRDGDQACLNFPNSDNEAYGKNYQKLTNMTSGILGSVCETDYANQLSVIGDSTTEQVRLVTLDCSPVDSDNNGAVDLVVKDAAGNVLTNYSVSGRMVTFSQVLPVGNFTFAYRCAAQ